MKTLARLIVLAACGLAHGADRPNILWITAEDMSPDLGCYGAVHASTPHIDRLASQGVRYTHAFAPIGVCAPSRSTLITGVFASSLGTQHMRCQGKLPEFIKCFPEYLRNAGYYCTNNAKEDYNFKTPKSSWDESSGKAHWRKRKEGQPFFAVFNLGVTHESQIWEENAAKNRAQLPPERRHDPAKITIPPYHPDTPEVRRDWANYHDNISVMDGQVANLLAQLEADGLADNTIVFYFSDHGAGMPRSKRWLYDSSLRVPLIVRFPEKWKHLSPGAPGSTVDRLVSFVDFGPTMLSLLGVNIPAHMQGVPFLGAKAGEPRQYIHGFRDRMDERYDMVRCVRDKKYQYIRNFMPHKPYFHAQYLWYANKNPTLRVWQELSRADKLDETPAIWMGDHKPAEELYDTEADPWEVHNLADSPDHREVLGRLRIELRRWMVESKDLGLLPEFELRTRLGDRAPYDAVRSAKPSFNAERLLEAADLPLARHGEGASPPLLSSPDPAVRWWEAMFVSEAFQRNTPTATVIVALLDRGLTDAAPDVRIEIAEVLARSGRAQEALPVLEAALKHENEFVRLRAANAIDNLDELARPILPTIRTVRNEAKSDKTDYVFRALDHAISELE